MINNFLNGGVNLKETEALVDRLGIAVGTYPYTITNTLTNCTSNNNSTTAMINSSYSATITASSGYTLTGATVSVTMGGNDITSTAYSNGVITIASVTGNLVINVSAVSNADPFLTFSSPNSFTLNVVDNTKYWDGVLETSTDKTNWTTWAGTSAVSSASDGNKHNIYVRGTGNTKITGAINTMFSASNPKGFWILTGSNISISGNIENLLDYQTVALGNHPLMAASCYRGLFGRNTDAQYLTDSITSIMELKLSAISLTDSCYANLFQGNLGIISIPSNFLPSINLAPMCYQGMFHTNKNLQTLPKLPATSIMTFSYNAMFNNCSKIKLSTVQDNEYINEYRIPTEGNGTYGVDAFKSMFLGTGGTFTGNPSVNTIYYTSNEVV